MKKLIGSLAGLVLLLALGALVLAYMQPSTYRVERSVTIEANVQDIYPYVSDLRQWKQWSPWAEKDPTMQMEFSENSSGLGAYAKWDSEAEGSGKQTVVEESAFARLKLDLEFYEPWTGTASTDFQFEALGEKQAKVTWGMDGTNASLMEKFFYAVMNFKKMIGTDYDKGLANLKKIAER